MAKNLDKQSYEKASSFRCPSCMKSVFEVTVNKKAHILDSVPIEAFINYQNFWVKRDGFRQHKCEVQ